MICPCQLCGEHEAIWDLLCEECLTALDDGPRPLVIEEHPHLQSLLQIQKLLGGEQ